MKRRLFWKILFAFWLTFLAITQGVWVLFALDRNQRPPPEGPFAHEVAPVVLTAGSQAIENGGPDGLNALMARLPATLRNRISLAPASSPASVVDDPTLRRLSQNAVGPDGRSYRLSFAYRVQNPPTNLIPGMPPPLLVLGVLGGLLFSAALAWYLTEPIARLRGGFDRLARGDLEVRLAPVIGRRRDEIADLGRDFDAMAQRLQQMVAARDRLLHDVSHELRSPLARLQLAIALGRQSAERTEATIARVEREAQRLEVLVAELLALARAEHGKPFPEDYFDLAGLVGSVTEDARFEAAASGVSIRLQETLPPEDERPLLMGNAELVHRALDNVLRNALRFSATGQEIVVDISYEAQRREYCVEIADEGPGIPDAEIDAMFHPFVRGDDRGSGFGLGLSIASRAVMAHGGTVRARNREESGFVISMTFPVAAEA